MSRSQILSNIQYHIEYSSDYTGVSVDYPTFSIAYLIYSTSHQPTLDSRICRPHGYWRMITKFIPKDQERGVEDAAIRNNEMRLQIPPHLVLRLEPLKRGTKTKPVLPSTPRSMVQQYSMQKSVVNENPIYETKTISGDLISEKKTNNNKKGFT